VDAAGAESLADVVAELAERRVVVAVTHRDELVRRADHHVVLSRHGRAPARTAPGPAKEATR
jgi:ABC-type transport system involved in cytochrome bd biosynthesis fused ATPase/permease subunit